MNEGEIISTQKKGVGEGPGVLLQEGSWRLDFEGSGGGGGGVMWGDRGKSNEAGIYIGI